MLPAGQTASSLATLTVVQLKAILNTSGVKPVGLKADLIRQVIALPPVNSAAAAAPVASSPPASSSPLPVPNPIPSTSQYQPASLPIPYTVSSPPTFQLTGLSASPSSHVIPNDPDFDEFDDDFELSADALAEIDAVSNNQTHPRMVEATRVLRKVFGKQDFRLKQREVIERLLVNGHNALVLFPTGEHVTCYSFEQPRPDGQVQPS